MKRVIVTSLFLFISIYAKWQNPTPIYVGPGDQTIDMVISDGAGGAAVLWHDSQTGWEFMNVIDSAGNLKWGKQGVAVLVMGDTTTANPDMFLDSFGNYWIALEAAGDIYVQKISPTGQRLFGDRGVAVCTAEGRQNLPRICPSGEGMIIAWWDSYRDLVFAQRIGEDGSVKWTANGVQICDSTENQPQRLADPVTDGKNGTVVIMHKRFLLESKNYVFAQHLDSLGNRQWEDTCRFIHRGTFSPLAIGPLANNAISDNYGGAIFFYMDGGKYRAQRVDTAGKVLWDTAGVSLGDDDYQCFGNFAPLSPDGIYVVRGESNAEIHQAVFAHRLTLDGEIPCGDTGKVAWWIWGEDPLGFTGDIMPSVSDNGIVVWRDVGDHQGLYQQKGIMAQRLDTLGDTLWSGAIHVCGTTGNTPYVISTNGKAGLVAWNDIRNGNVEVYATRIDSLGNLPPGIEEQPVLQSPVELEVSSSIALGDVLLRYALSRGEAGNLKLFDASGRMVKNLSVHGTGEVKVAGLSAGVYFCRLEAGGRGVTRKVVVVK